VAGFGANSFGFKLFGRTWIVYDNPGRRATFGLGAVAPVSFELHDDDGRVRNHAGPWLPQDMAAELRAAKLSRLVIRLA